MGTRAMQLGCGPPPPGAPTNETSSTTLQKRPAPHNATPTGECGAEKPVTGPRDACAQVVRPHGKAWSLSLSLRITRCRHHALHCLLVSCLGLAWKTRTTVAEAAHRAALTSVTHSAHVMGLPATSSASRPTPSSAPASCAQDGQARAWCVWCRARSRRSPPPGRGRSSAALTAMNAMPAQASP